MWMRNGTWTKKIDYGESKHNSGQWPKQPTWYRNPSDINNVFEAMCLLGISEKNAIKIVGLNWLHFMQQHF